MYLDKLHCEEIYEPEHIYKFSGHCRVTGNYYSVSVPGQALFRMRNGEHIQNVLPDMSEDDREFLISGISPEGWDQIFGGEDG